MSHDAGSLPALITTQILTLVALAAATIPAGRILLGTLETFSLEEDLALSAAAGLGLFGTTLALAGICGELRRPVIIAVAVLFSLGGLLGRRRARRAFDRDTRATLALVALPLAAIFVLGLRPPLAFDETLYHLPAAHAFAESHHLAFLPQLRFPVFPQLCETLFASIILVAGDSATHVLGVYATAVICLALAGWGRRCAAAGTGRLAAAAWLGCPLAVALASASYVDLELTMFLLVSLIAWEIGETTRDEGWRTRAALLAGFACATKYIALPILGGMIGLALVEAARRKHWSALGTTIGAAAAGAAIWYARIFILTGNPFFPLLAPVFGTTPWLTEHETAGRSILGAQVFELAGTARRTLTAMLPSAARPIPPFSPALLAAGVLGGLALRTARGRRFMLAAAMLLVLTRAYQDRFLLPFFAIVIAGCMEVVAPLDRRVSRTALGIAAAILLLPGLAGLLRSAGRVRSIPATSAATSDLLDRRLPGFRAIETLNLRFGSEYRVLVWADENLRDFARGDFVGDWFGLHPYGEFSASMSDGRSLWEALRRERIGWFLYDRKRHPRARPHDPSFAQRFRLDFDDGRVELFQIVTPVP